MRKQHRFGRGAAAVAVTVGALALASCSPPGTSAGDTEPAEGEPNRLVLAQNADFTTLDPHDLAETPGERVMRNVYSRLFNLDESMTPELEVATDYEQVDERTWRFTLRDDVTFHNGEVMDADDVAFSINRSAQDETLQEYIHYRGIEEATAIDAATVEVKTFEPMPTLLRTLAKSGGDIIPVDLVEEIGIDEFIKNPVGSGPYEIREWIRDDRVILDAFDDYFGEAPKWDEVEFRAIPEAATRVSELITGGVDVVTDVPPTDWDRLEEQDGVTLEFGETTRVMMLVLRTAEPWVTSDARVREAIDLAIDDGLITETLFKGAATPMRSRVPVGIFGANPDLQDTYLVDVDRARELVQEVGGGEPIKIHLTAPSGRYPLDSEVAEMIVGMLTDVGFEVDVEVLEGATFSEEWANKTQKEAVLIGLGDGLLDAAYSLGHYETGAPLNEGRTDYVNPEVNDRILEANSSMDQDLRERLYNEALAIVAEDRPHVFLYQQPAAYGVSDRVSFTPRLDDRMYFDDITLN